LTAVADLEAALEQVCQAARAHLDAVRAADGDVDDERVWTAFVSLNNASYAYDGLLEERYGEMTPWDVTEQLTDAEDAAEDTADDVEEPDGDEETVDDLRISVRQRRDYIVPQIDALLKAGDTARAATREDAEDPTADPAEPVRSVGEAIYELMQAGGGSLAGLDVPELVPQSGLVLANVLDDTLAPEDLDAPPHEADDLFALPDQPLIFSLYEPMYEADELDAGDARDEEERV
jgi:hypothetical protein